MLDRDGFPVGTCGGSVYQLDFSYTSYSGIVLSDSPLSYWRFGETAGATTAADATGAHAGTFNGTTLGEAGALKNDPNKALLNYAVDDSYVDIGDYYTFSGTAAFSLEAWVRPLKFTVDGHVIVSKIDTQRRLGNRLLPRGTTVR